MIFNFGLSPSSHSSLGSLVITTSSISNLEEDVETVTSLSVAPASISDSIERGTEFIFVPVVARAVVFGTDSMQIAEVSAVSSFILPLSFIELLLSTRIKYIRAFSFFIFLLSFLLLVFH